MSAICYSLDIAASHAASFRIPLSKEGIAKLGWRLGGRGSAESANSLVPESTILGQLQSARSVVY